MPSAQRSGQWAETLTVNYLRLQGLQLLARNFCCKAGEIDLIMQDHSSLQKNILVFVEVRYRRNNQFGGAAASVTRHKQIKISRTAQFFRNHHQHLGHWPARFDVVAVTGSLMRPQFTWIKAAFQFEPRFNR